MMKNTDALFYAKAGIETMMKRFKPEQLPPEHRFHYHQGVFLAGVEKVYELTPDKKYYDYIKAWVDFNIDRDGNTPNCFSTEFDDLQPGILLFGLYRATGDKRYKKVLERFNGIIEQWPTNAKGGVWHKYQNKNQMWLDSMYMMGVFTAMYANTFDNPYMFEKIATQMRLMRDYMTEPQTGLMYHMWDDSKQNEFVDRETGLVKVCWGRAIGWYAAALAEILECMPPEHHLRQEFIDTERRLLNSLRKYQNRETGLWYQVVDRGEDERNWLETSCTSLFTYAAAKALRLGVIDRSFEPMITDGYHGVLRKTIVKDGLLYVTGVCIGTGVGTLEDYFARPTVTNDLHGMGAFLLMCTEIQKADLNI